MNKNKISINVILILVCAFLCICTLCVRLTTSKVSIKRAKNNNWIIKEVKYNTENSIAEETNYYTTVNLITGEKKQKSLNVIIVRKESIVKDYLKAIFQKNSKIKII